MKGFLIRCAIAGAMIGGAAAATFQTISTLGPTTVGIAPVAAPAAAPAAAAPAAAPAAQAAVAAPAAPAPAAPGDPKGCVGAAVSLTAHQTQQVLDEGFGTFIHNVTGTGPGPVIQNFATLVCGKH